MITEAPPPAEIPPTPPSVPWAPKPIAAGSAFIGLCAMRNGEAQLRWQGAQLAFILNFPAYTGIAFRLIANPSMLELSVLTFGSVIFGFANLFLSRVLDRDNQYVTMWNDFLAALERANHVEGGLQFFSSDRYSHLRDARNRLQRRLLTAVRTCMFTWFGMALIALAILAIGQWDTVIKGALR